MKCVCENLRAVHCHIAVSMEYANVCIYCLPSLQDIISGCPERVDAAGVTSIAFTWRGVHHWWLFRWNDSFGFKLFLCMGEYWQRRHDCHLKVCLWPTEPAISVAMHSLESLSLSLTHTHTHTQHTTHTHKTFNTHTHSAALLYYRTDPKHNIYLSTYLGMYTL